MRKLGQRSFMAMAAIALGSAAFAGTALACDDDSGSSHEGHSDTNGDGGDGGNGGKTNVNCVLPIGLSAGIIGQGDDVSQCNATGGDGGDAGDGVDY